MQSITTKFIGPTDYRGSRVKARTYTGQHSVTLAWRYELGADGNHIAAAKHLAKSLGWSGRWVMGETDASGYVFVNVDSPNGFDLKEREEAA